MNLNKDQVEHTLSDYQLTRDKAKKVYKNHDKFGEADIIHYALATRNEHYCDKP